ncbi:DNA-J chaperone, putative [Bodo saltans]|uniref:DNA-J chaperone, putative n=1 Tax=Bodo saltans TaxID=75058 RepID=A0A0S4ITI3_BODSA|nr:DNA-J chaperone, putative [Bodo saltans]|eukprot:CUF84499.1 DNA-J chaperone, putative [Bodo saltans]
MWQRSTHRWGCVLVSPQTASRRHFSADFFKESDDPTNSKKDLAAVQYDHKHQDLHTTSFHINKEAFGIPFHISSEAALDAACKHHGTTVRLHKCEKLMLPFWLFTTSCGGKFQAELNLKDPTLMTSNRTLWMDTPEYNFSYPLDDHFAFNQVSASYLLPQSTVESCVCGTHIPSMLIQRFELLQELEAMEEKAKLIPFVTSTDTALKLVETRLTRSRVLHFAEKELKKHHGSVKYANIMLKGVKVDANTVRPVFLPIYHMQVSSKFSNIVAPVYVCGALGTVKGPVIKHSKKQRVGAAVISTILSVFFSAPLLGPESAIACGIGAGVLSNFVLQLISRARFMRDMARELGELKTTGILNFATDQKGYKWNVADEERAEYEYREELRRRARKKDDFQQRLKEEQERDDARARGMKFDPKSRRRNDLKDVDPLGYYKILGLEGREIGASKKDIQAAFREESKKHHPDLNIGNEESAKTVMQSILEAYRVLRDPAKKKLYDTGRLLKDGRESPSS